MRLMYSSSFERSTYHWPRPPTWIAGRSPERPKAYAWELEMLSSSQTLSSLRNRGAGVAKGYKDFAAWRYCAKGPAIAFFGDWHDAEGQFLAFEQLRLGARELVVGEYAVPVQRG
jgi:hypothetical protein